MDQINISMPKPLLRIPSIFQAYPNLISGESTRHGGISQSPYSSLNLGGSTGDQLEHVLENNIRFFSALGVPFDQVAKSHQVHGCEIIQVTQPERFEGYDALITNVPGIQLAVTIADCTPILIYDPSAKAIAAIHAGWRGTVQEIVYKTLEEMQKQYHSNPKDCVAYIGTCIDQSSFEVGPEVAAHFSEDHKIWNPEKAKFYVDLKKANQDQLLKAGIPAAQIEISKYSTVLHNEDYFSYRNENGTTGRMLATIGLKPTV
jgi:YfiH family protein